MRDASGHGGPPQPPGGHRTRRGPPITMFWGRKRLKQHRVDHGVNRRTWPASATWSADSPTCRESPAQSRRRATEERQGFSCDGDSHPWGSGSPTRARHDPRRSSCLPTRQLIAAAEPATSANAPASRTGPRSQKCAATPTYSAAGTRPRNMPMTAVKNDQR